MVHVEVQIQTQGNRRRLFQPCTEITELGFALGLVKTHRSPLKHQSAALVGSPPTETLTLGLLITERAHQRTHLNIFIGRCFSFTRDFAGSKRSSQQLHIHQLLNLQHPCRTNNVCVCERQRERVS